jgi:pyruvate kinase
MADMAARGSATAEAEGFAQVGQRVMMVAGVPFGTPGATNMIRIAFVSAPG